MPTSGTWSSPRSVPRGAAALICTSAGETASRGRRRAILAISLTRAQPSSVHSSRATAGISTSHARRLSKAERRATCTWCASTPSPAGIIDYNTAAGHRTPSGSEASMHRLALLALAIALGSSTTSAQTDSQRARGSIGEALNRGFSTADSLVAAAVGRTIPGAVLVVSQNGMLLHQGVFGWAELEDFKGQRLTNPRPMHATTLFDLASVTKVMATTMALMRLASDGRIDVEAPVYRYLPDFRGVHLDSITVRHLLTHSAGLVQGEPLHYHAADGPRA